MVLLHLQRLRRPLLLLRVLRADARIKLSRSSLDVKLKDLQSNLLMLNSSNNIGYPNADMFDYLKPSLKMPDSPYNNLNAKFPQRESGWFICLPNILG